MDTGPRFQIHCIAFYEPNNKIWGWLTTNDEGQGNYAYAFWSVVGKTISFKRHQIYNIRDHGRGWMRNLESTKIENKYVQISMEELLAMWPDFMDSLAYRFTFMQLSNGFEQR